MDVFAFREDVVSEYERFSRSFTRILAPDIEREVDVAYASEHFWPAPLIQLNPNFEPGGYIDELVSDGVLDAECAKIFRLKSQDNPFGDPLQLHRHQHDAISIAKRFESYVLTTGTGSGKSLAYFIPIIDDVLRRKRVNNNLKGISAIVVYPMNALCNSQYEELDRYLHLGYDEGRGPVTFARYTGQETNEDRERIAKNPPDILLTNYVMLELIMTRFLETDKAVRAHASGLRFLVLDELHTYRGRQGADVAMLVRRVSERFNKDLVFIGTSATMASEGSQKERDTTVARIASRLFGALVRSENIVSETIRPVTDLTERVSRSDLHVAIEQGPPYDPDHRTLKSHPVAAWVERNLGLHEIDGKFIRTPRPRTTLQASELLADHSGHDLDTCREYLAKFLLTAHMSKNQQGQSFFAFRLHQFISGAWNVYSTLEAAGSRYITIKGQQFKPGDREKRLFPTCFCRVCGQEYFPVWAQFKNKQLSRFETRDLTERSNDDEDVQFGYLMPDADGKFENHNLEQFPEEWLEFKEDQPRLKPNFRKYSPIPVRVNTQGEITKEGLNTWFIPSSFRFCLNPDCDAYYDGSVRSDLTKLSGLSSEGRSSATTVLVLSALKHLIGTDLDDQTKKLLAFTDNRQDASLQAGHFNDFIQILLLRGALLAAIQNTSDGRLTDDNLTQQVFSHLCLEPADYAANPEAKGIQAENNVKTLRDVLGYRLYFDLQRGWRITNPNLEQLSLLDVKYRGLMTCCEDEDEWETRHPLLTSISPEHRFQLCTELLDRMRRALCIKTIYLDPDQNERIRNRSYNELKEPWGLSEEDRLFEHAYMVPRSRKGRNPRKYRVHHISHLSVFGRKLKSKFYWGHDNPMYPADFSEDTYNTVIDHVMSVLTTYGYVQSTELETELIGYRINSSLFEWCLKNDSSEVNNPTNMFFRTLYENVASLLANEDRLLHQLESREHTAQVDPDIRQEREIRFRKGVAAQGNGDEGADSSGLPVLFCSPTMELGVDIAMLNTVYMRNVPPTPANYAQRSGRAGRSGQPALVVTYCAAKSPHDQFFFSKPSRMVAGVVNPLNIDLANEELIRSHLQSVWLAETGVKLGSSVREVLELENREELPVYAEIAEQIGVKRAKVRSYERSQRILSTLKHDLTEQTAPWYTDTWLNSMMNSTELRFNDSFERWRSLFRGTSKQIKLANSVVNNAAATEQERKEAKARYDEAFKQQQLLLDSRTSMNSDFYTYRYLAAEGFLPGYNFPRLPLMAFIPGRRQKIVRDHFLSRPRFIGLSEFGPQSIIYHEGSTYRVRKIILSVGDEESGVTASADLPMRVARICPSCGYAHFSDQKDFEFCVNCSEPLLGGRVISNLYQIDQVSTQRANRITSDEEERQRQGYEMISTFRFHEENGHDRVASIAVEESDHALFELRYGPSATLWRINLGWRRREEKLVYGFSIDTHTGEWTKDSQAPTDAEDDLIREGKSIGRITPFVEDTRNVLVLQPKIEMSETTMVSLQYALKRGIEQEFQLEESELAVEPLPDRDNFKTILFYEASEGGAGVLTRIVNDADSLPRIAKKALEVCHFQSKSGEWSSPKDLENLQDECEAGCYLCLLSYYNQPEHPKIDRQNEHMLSLLCRLTRSSRKLIKTDPFVGDTFQELWNASTSSLEKKWLEFIQSKDYSLPDQAQPYLEPFETRPDFAYSDSQVLIYVDGPHHETPKQRAVDEAIDRRLEDAGYTVVRFTADSNNWPSIVENYAWVF